MQESLEAKTQLGFRAKKTDVWAVTAMHIVSGPQGKHASNSSNWLAKMSTKSQPHVVGF